MIFVEINKLDKNEFLHGDWDWNYSDIIDSIPEEVPEDSALIYAIHDIDDSIIEDYIRNEEGLDAEIEEYIKIYNSKENLFRDLLRSGYYEEPLFESAREDFVALVEDAEISDFIIIEYNFEKYIGYAVNILNINFANEYPFYFENESDIPAEEGYTSSKRYVITDITKEQVKDWQETEPDYYIDSLYDRLGEYINYPINKGFDKAFNNFLEENNLD